jgi:hypothetical protein
VALKRAALLVVGCSHTMNYLIIFYNNENWPVQCIITYSTLLLVIPYKYKSTEVTAQREGPFNTPALCVIQQ